MRLRLSQLSLAGVGAGAELGNIQICLKTRPDTAKPVYTLVSITCKAVDGYVLQVGNLAYRPKVFSKA